MSDLSPGEQAVLVQLSRHHFTESGYRRGLADRSHGFAGLRQAGAALRERMDRVSRELG
jgi:hypothetical protein